jgi:exodeoxyribonuclease V alpha subunit
MHGGMKIYAGAPAAARQYVEADRGRADDYYLTEGAGVARRFSVSEGWVIELAPLTGDAYETWVAGCDPGTGEPRGQLRGDGHAVRFVEVVINGPKTWSLAAALHPDIATAYDAAQDRAAEQIIGWLGQHATTRVGPRRGQVQVPVEVAEAVTVAHYTSRAGDPHRHLHLQINARVFAAGKWRGLHTVGVRDSLAAINGIGHAAVATDPQFRAALAAHGYALAADGEMRQLSDFVGAFSARTQQIARNIDKYEREWTATHPGEHPGPALRRAWDARAWAEDRPDKVTPQSGADLTARWLAELAALGYRDHDVPVDLTPAPVGALDRDGAVERVLARLAAARSAWNAADIRGEVEQLIAADGIVTDAAVRIELAEDLTARALDRCVPLLQRDGVPGHIRAWTSARVLAVEAELTARLADRATAPGLGLGVPDTALAVSGVPDGNLTVVPGTDLTPPPSPRFPAGVSRLDAGQAAAAAVLSGDRRLVVIEGAAGAGKTTTLAATRALLAEQGRRLVVVTPTLKAAKVAAAEVGTAAGSAAWLAFQHGWRWDDDGTWTRLAVGQADPATGRTYPGLAEAARLRAGDLLVVDEAGMLDQDTARALLTVADERQVRLALVGDRHQLAAVGRGGVLDLAAAQVGPAGHLTLDGVHRFARTDDVGNIVPDGEYADLTLAMRAGTDPGAVFDALAARGQIRLHPDDDAMREALADAVAATASSDSKQRVAVVVDTRDQAEQLNAAIRGRLVDDGRVDDTRVATTQAGQRIGTGDRIATRRNDRDLDVANRDTWIVTAVGRDGELVVTPADAAAGDVLAAVTPAALTPAGSVPARVTSTAAGQRVLPADYVTAHVELAYASTAHGVQGDTVTTAHTVVVEHTGAASAYVGMTRGRQDNTAHLVAEDLTEAREQWIAAFARDRADLGPAHAAQQAAAEAARHAPPKPLNQVLAELEEARLVEWGCRQRLAVLEPRRDALAEMVANPDPAGRLEGLRAAHRQTLHDADRASRLVETAGAAVTADASRIRSQLLAAWRAQRGDAATAARTLWAGPGWFGLHRGAVSRAEQKLASWAEGWRPLLPAMPTDPRQVAEIAGRSDYPVRPAEALGAASQARAEHAHPEHAALAAAATAAQEAADRAWRAVADARRECDDRAYRFGPLASLPNPAARLAESARDLTATRAELTAAQARIAQLTAEPAYRNQPRDQAATDRPTAKQRSAEQRSGERAGRRGRPPLQPATQPRRVPESSVRPPHPEDLPRYGQQPGHGRGIGR